MSFFVTGILQLWFIVLISCSELFYNDLSTILIALQDLLNEVWISKSIFVDCVKFAINYVLANKLSINNRTISIPYLPFCMKMNELTADF